MSGKTSYKKSLRYLVAGFILLLLLSYSFSIKKTIRTRNMCIDLEEQLATAVDAPQRISQLEQKLADINGQIGSNISGNTDYQELLLEKVSRYCSKNRLVLKQLPQTHSYVHQDFKVETHKVVVEGSFHKLLKLIYAIENDFKLGKLVSVRFETEKDFVTKSISLTASIYFQNIKSIPHEKT